MASRTRMRVSSDITETVYDGGLRRAQTESARAALDGAVATYRQTVLTAFQGVKDNLSARRILEKRGALADERPARRDRRRLAEKRPLDRTAAGRAGAHPRSRPRMTRVAAR